MLVGGLIISDEDIRKAWLCIQPKGKWDEVDV